MNTPDCTRDSGVFFCGTVNITQPRIVRLTWTPPQGTTTITFNIRCETPGCADAPLTTIATIVTSATQTEQNLFRDTLNNTQRATAESLNQLCATTSNEGLIIQCNNLLSLNDTQLSDALNQIAPDEVTAQGTNSVEVTTTQLSNVRARLASLRNGPSKTRFAMKGVMLAMNGDTLPAGLLADSSDFGSGLSSLIKDSRLGLFMSGRINFGEKDSTSRESGFDFETLGITAGLDYWYNSKLVMGGALGYAKTDSDFNANGGNLDSTAYSTSFYGSYYLREDAYFDWITTYGSNDFSTRRTIIYSGINTATQGNTSGSQLGLSATATIDYRFGKLLISPYVRADYVNANIKGYRETGGSGFALAIEKQNTKSFATALAVRASRAISQRWGVLVSSAHIEWEHEFKDDDRLITARFVENPTTAFSIQTDAPDRNYFKLGTALSATFPRGKSAYISVATVAGQDTITSSTIDLGARMEF
ncbi:MAG: autotransporter outer membrane beta-barrel domain-containing protein [Gammaproteobacteria bacterium]|nr:autotransporter outer membrane beta-barrel domain-containing protein [Gammaproteobacteria bacterium]